MDQEIIPVIFPVIHFILSEWYIADHTVKKAVRKLRRFKTLYSNLILLVELPGNPAGYGIQLHAVHAQIFHAVRNKSHEISHAAARLQHITGRKPHISKSFIHGLDYGRRRIESIQRACPGFPVFLRCQCSFYLRILAGPFPIICIKCLRNAAPSYEP